MTVGRSENRELEGFYMAEGKSVGPWMARTLQASVRKLGARTLSAAAAAAAAAATSNPRETQLPIADPLLCFLFFFFFMFKHGHL